MEERDRGGRSIGLVALLDLRFLAGVAHGDCSALSFEDRQRTASKGDTISEECETQDIGEIDVYLFDRQFPVGSH